MVTKRCAAQRRESRGTSFGEHAAPGRHVDDFARLREALEAPCRAHPLRERALACAADHRAIRERVGKGYADLYDVRSASGNRLYQVCGVIREWVSCR